MSRKLETLGQALSRGGYVTGAFSSSLVISSSLGISRGFQKIFYEQDRDDLVAVSANDWADGVRKGTCRPFFLFVHFLAPHRPYAPPPSFLPRSYEYRGPLPKTSVEVFDDLLDGEPLAQRIMGRQALLAEEDRHHVVTLYNGEVRWFDQIFGGFVKRFDRDPSARDTVIAMTADHGDFLGEKNLLDHGHLPYEGVLRVPLIVRFPPSRHPDVRECASAVSSMDLYPTFLRSAGVAPRHPLASEDLSTIVSSGCPPSRLVIADGQMSVAMKLIFGERFALGYRTITNGRWKLLRRDDGTLELYDLDHDPGEDANQAKGEPRRAAVLLRALEEFEEHEVRYPTAPEPDFTPEELRRFRALGYLR